MEHVGDSDTIDNQHTWNGPQMLGKGDGGVGSWRTNRNHSNYGIIEVGQNSEKNHGDMTMKMKEGRSLDKYLVLARELKKLWNMKVGIIPNVIGALVIVHKSLKKRIDERETGERIESLQFIALLKSARILRIVLESWKELLQFNLQLRNMACW